MTVASPVTPPGAILLGAVKVRIATANMHPLIPYVSISNNIVWRILFCFPGNSFPPLMIGCLRLPKPEIKYADDPFSPADTDSQTDIPILLPHGNSPQMRSWEHDWYGNCARGASPLFLLLSTEGPARRNLQLVPCSKHISQTADAGYEPDSFHHRPVFLVQKAQRHSRQ